MTSPATPGRLPSAPESRRPRRARTFRSTGPRRLLAALAVAIGMLLAGAGASALVTEGPRPPKNADRGALPDPPSADTPTPATAATVAPPVRIRIARIGLDDPLTGLQVQPDGHLGVPEDPQQVGWWSEGPRPGAPGAAVIVGHIDSLTGPAAFYNLSSLRPGDTITVDRDDHSRATFTVRALRQYDKNHFPDDQVYTQTGAPALRLITCGGTYDRQQRDYRDNLVVYATLATHRPTAPSPTRSGN